MKKLPVGAVRTSDISDLDQICPMGDSSWLEIGWVRYIQSRRGAMALEPDESRTNPVGQIYPSRTTTMVLEPDEYISSGRIYPTR
jgi:hypothetical protein